MASPTQFGRVSRCMSSPAAHSSKAAKASTATVCIQTSRPAFFVKPDRAPLSRGKRAIDAREDTLDRRSHGAEQRDGNDRDQAGDQGVFNHRHALIVRLKITNETKHSILHWKVSTRP